MSRRDRTSRAPRVIAIGGGKGGVGKSIVSLNLGAQLAKLGHRVMMVDADLGSPNLHTLLGASRPGPGLAGFIDHDVERLVDAAVEVGIPNLRLVPGTARPGAANLPHAQKVRLLRAVVSLPADIVLVDVGAGAAYNTLDFVAIADIKLVVMTPELTSLNNAYGFLKSCVHRVVRRAPPDESGRAILEGVLENQGEARPIRDAVAVLRDREPALAECLVDALVRFGAGVVGNMIDTPAEAAVVTRMSRMISDYLLVHAPVLASIPRSAAVRASMLDHRPVVLTDARDGFREAIAGLATAVLSADIARLRGTTEHTTLPIWVERATG